MTESNIKEVIFHGKLAKKYGKKHKVNAKTILLANLQLKSILGPGYEKDIVDGKWKVIRGSDKLEQPDYVSPEEVEMGTSKGTIHIIPEGTVSSGVFKIILGIVLVVVGIVAMCFGQEWGMSLVMMGIGMIAGGIAQMLAPHPSTSNDNNNPTLNSYSFSGGTNITSQGCDHPVVYGPSVFCSSVQVSTGLGVLQLKDAIGS